MHSDPASQVGGDGSTDLKGAQSVPDAGSLASRTAGALSAGTLSRAVARLTELQHPLGWWKGELETNVSMDAEDMLLRHFLGIVDPQRRAAVARWIAAKQDADGTWSSFFGGPPDLSVTVEAYVALRLAGHSSDLEAMRRAAAWVRDQGGVERTRLFTRFWLALFGLWRWDALPARPAELILLPSWFPCNIYDFACWARQTMVPLTVVAAHRPVRPVPFSIEELRGGLPPEEPPALFSTAGMFHLLGKALAAYERLPFKPLRRLAFRRAEAWIVERQEPDGSWGGIQPPWVYSMLALSLLGYSMEHPVLASAVGGLEAFSVTDGDQVRLEACQSPVWDTALAVLALADAGADPSEPALVSAADWLVGQEVTKKGDWAVRRPHLEPGGWAFEFENDNYPDVDDTALVVLALRRCEGSDPLRTRAAVLRAVEWVVGMQCRDGGWAAFDAENTSRLVEKLPVCDFGEVTDPPSADVTAHAVEMLAATGTHPDALSRGVAWLWREQEDDGAWFGRWGANYVYGTGAAVPALVAAGAEPSDPRLAAAGRFLCEHQNADGGWGEDMRSYTDPAWRGRGASTPSQTSWALLALLCLATPPGEARRAHGGSGDGEVDIAQAQFRKAIRRGVEYLAATQDDDGSWDEPYFTGTGFPGDFHINYHLYRLVFPVMALGRWRSWQGLDRPEDRHNSDSRQNGVFSAD